MLIKEDAEEAKKVGYSACKCIVLVQKKREKN